MSVPSTTSSPRENGVIGLLLSGGLDSTILLGHLLERGGVVQPFYVRAGLYWEQAESSAVERIMSHWRSRTLRPLKTFDMPLADLYGDHWSLTGREVPDARTPDEAVYLPGRNLLLTLKGALWCGLHGIGTLALAPLGSNPFADATPEFFRQWQSVLESATGARVALVRPFADFHKRKVMELGRRYPLELTFSCIAPRAGLHCGVCNKCAERREAFRIAELPDPTTYAAGVALPDR